jgi:hypothetical protein
VRIDQVNLVCAGALLGQVTLRIPVECASSMPVECASSMPVECALEP